MNKEIQNIIHDLRGELDQVNICFNCIVFDFKEDKKPSSDDIADAKKSIQRLGALFETLTKGHENESTK